MMAEFENMMRGAGGAQQQQQQQGLSVEHSQVYDPGKAVQVEHIRLTLG